MKSIIFGALILVLVLGGWFYQDEIKSIFDGRPAAEDDSPAVVTSFNECADAGYAVLESFPRQCRTPDGRTFTEDIGNALEKQDLIRTKSPRPNDVVRSPLNIEGEARGTWYFEASFPVTLYDGKGKVIARGPAEAQAEWMTAEFVPFKLGLKFDEPETATGYLLLEKDNPSGLPEHADELRVPVRFR